MIFSKSEQIRLILQSLHISWRSHTSTNNVGAWSDSEQNRQQILRLSLNLLSMLKESVSDLVSREFIRCSPYLNNIMWRPGLSLDNGQQILLLSLHLLPIAEEVRVGEGSCVNVDVVDIMYLDNIMWGPGLSLDNGQQILLLSLHLLPVAEEVRVGEGSCVSLFGQTGSGGSHQSKGKYTKVNFWQSSL